MMLDWIRRVPSFFLHDEANLGTNMNKVKYI